MWTSRRKQPSLPSHDTEALSNWVPNIPPGDGFSEPAENAFIVLKWDHQEAKWKQLENGKAVEWERIEEEETSTQDEPRDLPRGPVVKNPPCNAGDAGSIPGQGTKVPHVAE